MAGSRFWNFDGRTPTPSGRVITGAGLGYAAVSKDGTRLLVGGTAELDLFDLQTAARVRQYFVSSSVVGVGFSPDGSKVIGVDNDSVYGGTIYLFDTASGQLLDSRPLSVDPSLLAVAPAPATGAFAVAVTGYDGDIEGYSVTGNALGGATVIAPSIKGIWGAAFSPNGATLAAGGDDANVRFWNAPLASAASVAPNLVVPNADFIEGLAFSPNGTYLAVAAGDFSGSVSIWNAATRAQVARYAITANSNGALSVAFSPTGNAVVVGEFDCGKILVCTQ